MRVHARTFLCVQKHYKLLRPIQAAFSRRTNLVKRKNVPSEAFLLVELNIHQRLKVETIYNRRKILGFACELSDPFRIFCNIIPPIYDTVSIRKHNFTSSIPWALFKNCRSGICCNILSPVSTYYTLIFFLVNTQRIIFS